MASHYHSLLILLPLISLISFVQSYNNGGVTIDLIHRESPLSPSHDPTKTRFERLRNAVNRSFNRKTSIYSTISKRVDATETPLSSAGGEYLIEYKLGTPPVRQLSIADTGSDLTWIQCSPCTSCYKQDYPLFKPSATSTYKTIGCQTNACAAGGSTGCGSNDVCQYQVQYGDRSYSEGDLASDTLTLGARASFRNFVFGCGKNNDGTFQSTGSGIFGLGNGPVSIVNQRKSDIGGRFSYCLTPFSSNLSSTISFGRDAVVSGRGVLSTPLVSKEPDTFYYLTLEGFTVGSQRFDYSSPGVNQFSDEGNIIIDSGTTLTFVPEDLYQNVESELESAINAPRVTDPQGTFGLCYQSEGGQFSSPQITANFRGADVEIPQTTAFMEVEEGVVCLTIVPSQEFGIFGNLHQEGYLVGYDLVEKQINFLKKDCTTSS